MRVALIALHHAEYSLALADGLAQKHDVLLVLERGNALADLGSTLPVDTPARLVHYVEHRADPRAAVAQAVALRRLLGRFGPDVVHAQEVIYDSWALLLLTLGRWPLVLTVHDPVPHSGEDMRGFRRRYSVYQSFQRWRCDVAITHGDALVSQLTMQVPRLAGRVVSIPHGVLGRRPTDAPLVPVDPAGPFLFLGRMHSYKGLGIFLDALRVLRQRGYDVQAVLAGRGPALNEVREELATTPYIHVDERFLQREKMLAYVDAASVVVTPYLDGTQSGIAMLAIGRGRPVVSSQVGSLPEVVHDGVNGVLVRPGDVAALTDALAGLITDSKRILRLAQASEDMAVSEFGWDSIARRTAEAYVVASSRYRVAARACSRHAR